MRSKDGWYLIFGLLFACLPCACIADDVSDHVLSMDEAVRMSVENQPALRSHDSNSLASSTIRFINTDDPKLAEIKTAVENFRSRQNLLTQDILTLGDGLLPVEDRIKIRFRRNRQVQHSPEAAILSRVIKRDAALAWLRLYYAQHAVVLQQAMLTEYADQIASSKIAFRAGKNSQTDIWKAEDAFNAARSQEIELRNQIADAQADLARWIGDKPYTLDEKMASSAPPAYKDLKAKIGSHPMQLMYWFAQEIADAEMKAVEDNYRPDPKTELHPEEPIMPTLHALREKLDSQATDSIRMLESELSKAYTDWQFAQERLDLYEKSVVPNAPLRLQATMIDYGNGKADFSAVLEARRYALEAKIELLQLQIAAAKARIQLDFYE